MPLPLQERMITLSQQILDAGRQVHQFVVSFYD